LLVGDAFAFIDPVFSSGVFLAMSSAERAVPMIDAWLAGDERRYRLASRRYSRDIDRAIAVFSWFIYRFTTPAMRYLFSNPRDVLGIRAAVTSMLAGDVFDNAGMRRRLMVFKAFYAIASLVHWRETQDLHKSRLAAERAGIGDKRLAR
jgi:flavin-dependent dehydrogenase